MNSTKLMRIAGTVLFAAMAIPTQIFAQNQSAIKEDKAERVRYTVTDLGPLPGGTYSQALVLNNNGLAVGRQTELVPSRRREVKTSAPPRHTVAEPPACADKRWAAPCATKRMA